MALALNNNEGRDHPALRIDPLDHCRPFPIARLSQFRLASPFRAYNNHRWSDLAHGEAGLVEVVDVSISDSIFQDCIAHKIEPALNEL